MKLSSGLGLAFCLCLAVNAQAALTDPVIWSSLDGGNNHLYELTPTRDTWTAQEAYAVAIGGHLVSINSQAEQNFLISTFLVGSTSTVPLWIGLTDQPNHDSESYTTWTTSEAVTFRNFNPNEPNNSASDEDYVAMNWHYSFGSSNTMGTWNDLPNGGSTVSYNDTNARALGPYYGVIEIVPEPGTVWLLAVAGLFLVCWKTRRAAQVQLVKQMGC